MASSILLKFPRNTEVQTKEINIDDALSRVRRPLDSTKLTLSVNGIFALPESWKAKIQTVSIQSMLTVTNLIRMIPMRPCTPMRLRCAACG